MIMMTFRACYLGNLCLDDGTQLIVEPQYLKGSEQHIASSSEAKMFVSDFLSRVPYRNSSSHLLMTLRRLFIYHQRSNSLSSPSRSYLLKQKQMLDSSVFPGQAHVFRASVLTESTVKIGGSKYRHVEIYPSMIVYCRQAKKKRRYP
jgi:hypothetical protein